VPRRRQSWVVSPGERRVLGQIVEPAALGDGRVFVDGHRQTDPGLKVAAGSRIDVHRARSADEPVRLLEQRSGLIAAYKPAAIATEPDRQGARGSLVHEVARLVGCKPSELHAASRLDVGVSGVVVLVRAPARAPAESERRYVAIAACPPGAGAGVWSSAVGARGRARPASSRFAVLGQVETGATLLVLEPVTGRAHQLRIHAARAGAPLLGDRAHGAGGRVVLPTGEVVEPGRIALHALRVRIDGWEVIAPVPERLLELWGALGGDPGDFAPALEKELGS
jgi:23S rRNA pseudouridine1911/1915/1917 synthase